MFPLTEPSIEIKTSPARQSILISQTRNWQFIGFLVLWLGWVWLAIPLFIASSSNDSILCFYFPAAILLSLYPLYMLLWHLGSKERVEVESGHMNIYEIRPLRLRKQEFAVNQILHLRKAESTGFDSFRDWGMKRWGMTNGKIVFDYARQTYRFGRNISDTQTQLVIQTLSEWLDLKMQP